MHNKEYFLECLANPWIFNSVVDFQSIVQGGGIIPSDGYGELLFINKETLQLEEDVYCFCDGVDIWKIANDEDHYGLPNKTIKRIIEHFSDDKRQLIGVLWYNK